LYYSCLSDRYPLQVRLLHDDNSSNPTMSSPTETYNTPYQSYYYDSCRSIAAVGIKISPVVVEKQAKDMHFLAFLNSSNL
jgi:hypothetical protein